MANFGDFGSAMKFIGSNLSTSWCKLSLGLVWYSCSLSMAEYNQWQKESLSDLGALNIDTHHSWLSRVNLSVCIPKKRYTQMLMLQDLFQGRSSETGQRRTTSLDLICLTHSLHNKKRKTYLDPTYGHQDKGQQRGLAVRHSIGPHKGCRPQSSF